MISMDIVIDELNVWTRHATVGQVFPRQMFLVREIVTDEYDYFKKFRMNKGIDVYLSVFSEFQIRRRLFDTIFMDFDPDSKSVPITAQIESAYDKFIQAYDMVHDAGFDVRVYFSGRGFHMYIDYEPTRIEHFSPVVRKFLQYVGIVDKYGNSRFVDSHVIGDIQRMARVPESINSRTNMKVKRIDPKWSLDQILDYVQSDNNVSISIHKNGKSLVSLLLEYDKQMTKHRANVVKYDYLSKWDLSSFPKCMYEGVMRLKYLGELDDVWRWNLANFLIRSRGYEEAKEVFKFASDYDENITDYRLNHIVRKEYMMMSCKRLREVGICPYADQTKCPFYPSINHWLPSWNEVKKDESNE